MTDKDNLELADSNETQNKASKILKESLHMLFYLILVFLTSYMVIHFIGQRTQVIGQSMENTLYDQDNLIVDKFSYNFADPQRYDIIVFPVETEDVYYIKRIIGLPGETIQIVDGAIYINDEILDENYGKETIALDNSGLASQPILLGEDEYFVLGDNRNHSTDSREPEVGTVTRTSIVGKAWVRVWPFNRLGVLKHQ